MPGNVGEPVPANRDGKRGNRAVANRSQDGETESVTVESGAETTRSVKGGFDDDAGDAEAGGEKPPK